jgi:hypothetical protein
MDKSWGAAAAYHLERWGEKNMCAFAEDTARRRTVALEVVGQAKTVESSRLKTDEMM